MIAMNALDAAFDIAEVLTIPMQWASVTLL